MQTSLTIAIPVFNRSTYFHEALASALSQTEPVPLLVVDNASDAYDFESAVAQYGDARVRYVRNHRNLGMVGNWNRCIELCQTEYLAILHDDDTLERTFAQRVLPTLSARPSIVVGRNRVIDADGRVIEERTSENFQRFASLRAWCFEIPTFTGITFSVGLAKQLGGFHPGLPYTPDFDLWFRLGCRGEFQLIDEVLASYRTYSSPDRITTGLEKRFETTPRLRVQIRRNLACYHREHPELPALEMCRPFLDLRAFLKAAAALPERRARYALALYVNTLSPTFAGRLLRRAMRWVGWAMLYPIRMLHALRHSNAGL